MGSKKTLLYRYDSVGIRSGLTDPDGGRFTYAYDAVNRTTLVQNPQGERTTFQYDDAGRRTLRLLANGSRASFTYDDAGRMTKLYNLKGNGSAIATFDYQYDPAGNRTSVVEADGSRVTWTYDHSDQLLSEHRSVTSPYRHTFTYDSRGNRTLKQEDAQRTTYAYDAANQLRYSQTGSNRTTYTFDADGNQQVALEPSADRTTYVWDYENRMSRAELPAGVRNTVAYEPDGLRVKLEETAGVKKFVWDDQNYLAETDAANDTQVLYTLDPRQYGNLISHRQSGATTSYHFDVLGSTRSLTNASQVVQAAYDYGAWGVILGSPTLLTRMLYVGQSGYRWDLDLQAAYVRARYYQPVLARWLSSDPLWPQFDLVTYRYSHNSPLLLIDSSGLAVIDCSDYKLTEEQANAEKTALAGCACGNATKPVDEALAWIECDGKGEPVVHLPKRLDLVRKLGPRGVCFEDCGLIDCTKCHENHHIDQFKAICPDCCKDKPKGGVITTLNRCAAPAECYAHIVSFSCMASLLETLQTAENEGKGKSCKASQIVMGKRQMQEIKCTDYVSNYIEARKPLIEQQYHCLAEHKIRLYE